MEGIQVEGTQEGGLSSRNPLKNFEPHDCIIYSFIIIQIINGPIQDLTSSFKLLISCLFGYGRMGEDKLCWEMSPGTQYSQTLETQRNRCGLCCASPRKTLNLSQSLFDCLWLTVPVCLSSRRGNEKQWGGVTSTCWKPRQGWEVKDRKQILDAARLLIWGSHIQGAHTAQKLLLLSALLQTQVPCWVNSGCRWISERREARFQRTGRKPSARREGGGCMNL